jgi:alpha-beta hydrolase superfamily lysophospholipase
MSANESGLLNGITAEWPVLAGIARTVGSYLKGRAPPVPAASFARLYAAERSDLPGVDYVAARDGFPLACRHYPAASARLALLVHGAAGHSAHMHTLARAIAGRGLAQAVAVDLRGHGHSVRRPGHDVAYFGQLRDDLDDMLAAFHARYTPGFVVLIGYSAGGGLLLRVAESSCAARVSAFALLAPFLGADAPSTRPRVGGWVEPDIVRIGLLLAFNLFGIRRGNDATVVRFNQPPQTRDGLEVLSWSFNTMIAFGPRAWRRGLAAIGPRRPLLITAGDADDCFYPGIYRQMADLAAPHAKVAIVPGCSHWDMLVLPQAVEAVTGWLATL